MIASVPGATGDGVTKLTIRVDAQMAPIIHPPHPLHLASSDFPLNTLFSIYSIVVKRVLESDLP